MCPQTLLSWQGLPFRIEKSRTVISNTLVREEGYKAESNLRRFVYFEKRRNNRISIILRRLEYLRDQIR